MGEPSKSHLGGALEGTQQDTKRIVSWTSSFSFRVVRFAGRSRDALALSAAVGVATGIVVALYERILGGALFAVTSSPTWLLALLPGAGLVLTYLILRMFRSDSSTSISDD